MFAAQKIISVFGHIKGNVASRLREVTLTLCFALVNTGMLCSALEAQVGLEEGYEDEQGTGTPAPQGPAERAGVIQPEKEKALVRPYNSIPVLKGTLQEG